MIKSVRSTAGFSAVELLITLFVAAAFLIAGYQLFAVVIRESGSTNAETKASNVAYDYLRQYEASATNPCSPQTLMNASPVTIDGLVDVAATVTITCPNASLTRLSRVEVRIEYNNPRKNVVYATYSNGSSTGGSITNGLVGWWRMDGNADAATGSANGTLNNVTSSIGQNGSANGALNFNTTASYMNVPSNVALNVGSTFTISAWIKPTEITGNRYGIFSTRLNNAAGSWQLEIGQGNGSTNGWGRVAVSGVGTWIVNSPNDAVAADAWQHLVYVKPNDASVGTVYVNGSAISSTVASITYPITDNTDAFRIGQGTSNTQSFRGEMDDVRFYNRALSNAEVASLFSGGAQ